MMNKGNLKDHAEDFFIKRLDFQMSPDYEQMARDYTALWEEIKEKLSEADQMKLMELDWTRLSLLAEMQEISYKKGFSDGIRMLAIAN